MRLLASSCLQGQPLARAVFALLRLHPDGIQLCPGHPPSPGLRGLLAQTDLPLRYHHGFSWTAYRQDPWLLPPSPDWSLHPPQQTPSDWRAWLVRQQVLGRVLEIMPPGRFLGADVQIRAALDAGVRLAVDIAHLHILTEQGAISSETRRRLLEAERLAEVHLSDSDGRLDLHRPLTAQTPLLSWARERMVDGVPGVLECYMHRLSPAQRAEQLEMMQ